MNGRPTAATGTFPYYEHRTLEQVDRDECLGCISLSVCPYPQCVLRYRHNAAVNRIVVPPSERIR